MKNLTKAHQELYRRTPDESFLSFDDLYRHCADQRARSTDIWERPQDVVPTSNLTLTIGEENGHRLNDWLFSQLCRMTGVSKETINRLSPQTASMALEESLPCAGKPLQILATDDEIRAVHGVAYTRLWNAEFLDVVKEYASDFRPPQLAMDGASSGLYCRKHTANVRDGLNEIRCIIESLVARRDQRRDSFVSVIKKAMGQRLGSDVDEVLKALSAEKIPRHLIKDANGDLPPRTVLVFKLGSAYHLA